MEIGVDARTAVGDRSGVGNYLLNVLRSEALEGHSVVAYYLPGEGDPPDVDFHGESLDWTPLSPPSIASVLGPMTPVWWVNVTLRRALQNDDVDCFFGPNFVQPIGFDVPSVVVVHDLIHRVHPSSLPLAYRLYLRVFLSLSLRSCNHVVTVSKNTANDLRQFHAVPEQSLSIAPPAAANRFHPRTFDAATEERFRERYDLPETFVLYVGNVEPRKNVATLVRAVQSVDEQLRCPLVVVGQRHHSDPELDDVLDDAETDNLVRFTGYVPDSDLPLLYNLASVFAYPSRYEGFGIPPLEAMQSGTPTVVSNRASLPEVVGDAAITVDPDDVAGFASALETLLGDSDQRREYRKRGLARADSFSWERTATEIVEALEKAIEQGGR